MEQIICVPLHTPVPKDPDLGWETDSPGEKVTIAQLLGMLLGYNWASAGLFSTMGTTYSGTYETPPWGAACPLLQGSLHPTVGLADGSWAVCADQGSLAEGCLLLSIQLWALVASTPASTT